MTEARRPESQEQILEAAVASLTEADVPPDEVAMALTLTARAAGVELDLALDLAGRPATAAALETGQIDLPRAKILVSLLGPLAPAHADAVRHRSCPGPGR